MPSEQLYNQHSSPSRVLIKPFGAKATRVPVSSIEPEFVPSPASGIVTGMSKGDLRISASQGVPLDPVRAASAAAAAGLLSTTPQPEVELFAPLETTDWTKYWPFAAAGVGVIGLVLLLGRRRRKG